MSTNKQEDSNEDVDLGKLFIIIGKGFSNFFNFFGNIFKGLYHIIIVILIFLKTNVKKIGISLFIGAVAGCFLEVNKTPKYSSEMLVQPNFKSARQLYNNISFYNDLVKQKDIKGIQEVFNLDKERAISLKSFEIEPIILENDIISSYDNLITDVDTLTIRSYDYDLFKSSFTNYDYKTHKIKVIAEKNDVFPYLGKKIVASLENNNFFNKVKKIYNTNLISTDSLYKENLTQIDSLRKVYMKVLVEEAKKETAGTSIDLGSEKGKAKELELFETNRRINLERKKLVKEKSEKYDVVNIVSDFQPIGYEIKGITNNNVVLFGGLGALLMICFLLLLKLNKYLDNYKK